MGWLIFIVLWLVAGNWLHKWGKKKHEEDIRREEAQNKEKIAQESAVKRGYLELEKRGKQLSLRIMAGGKKSLCELMTFKSEVDDLILEHAKLQNMENEFMTVDDAVRHGRIVPPDELWIGEPIKFIEKVIDCTSRHLESDIEESQLPRFDALEVYENVLPLLEGKFTFGSPSDCSGWQEGERYLRVGYKFSHQTVYLTRQRLAENSFTIDKKWKDIDIYRADNCELEEYDFPEDSGLIHGDDVYYLYNGHSEEFCHIRSDIFEQTLLVEEFTVGNRAFAMVASQRQLGDEYWAVSLSKFEKDLV